MSKYRLLFEKTGTACYISHLDLMRTFQRLFLRGGMFIKHSKGFHPHPVMSIVLPLPVGQSSCCELLDFETENEDVDLQKLPELINAGCPEGLRVIEAYEQEKAVRDLAYVEAEITMYYDHGVAEGTVAHLEELFSREQVIIQKKTKHKKMADVDLIPLIREISFKEREKCVLARVTVCAQNPGLNPALLMTAIENELPEYKVDFATVRRIRIMDAEGTVFR